MLPRLPSRKTEIKKKDDENVKKEDILRTMEAKIALSKTIMRRRKAVQTLSTIAAQCQAQQHILASVVKELDDLGCESERIVKIIEVLQKVEVVLYRETAKL